MPMLLPDDEGTPDSGLTNLTLELVEKKLALGVPKMAAYDEVGRAVGKSKDAVKKLWLYYHPQEALAKRILQANAAVMAENVVSKGSVSEHIDVLTRLDVLPSAKKAGGSDMGFFLSVEQGSLGGFNIKAGMALRENEQPALPPVQRLESLSSREDILDVTPEEPEVYEAPAPKKKRPSTWRERLIVHRQRLAEMQTREAIKKTTHARRIHKLEARLDVRKKRNKAKAAK